MREGKSMGNLKFRQKCCIVDSFITIAMNMDWKRGMVTTGRHCCEHLIEIITTYKEG